MTVTAGIESLYNGDVSISWRTAVALRALVTGWVGALEGYAWGRHIIAWLICLAYQLDCIPDQSRDYVVLLLGSNPNQSPYALCTCSCHSYYKTCRMRHTFLSPGLCKLHGSLLFSAYGQAEM